MTDLSDEDSLSIHNFPLKPTIRDLRKPLRQAIESISTESQKTEAFSSEEETQNDTTKADEQVNVKDVISGLVYALMGHRVTKRLQSTKIKGTVTVQLSTLFGRHESDQIDATPFLQLIVSASRITPPVSSEPSCRGTPRTHRLSSPQDSGHNKTTLEESLRDELWNCSYFKVSGFFDKYFDGKSWTQLQHDAFKSVQPDYGRLLTKFLSHPTESAVWNWWSSFQDTWLADSRGKYCKTESEREMTGLDSEGQLDLLIVASRHTGDVR